MLKIVLSSVYAGMVKEIQNKEVETKKRKSRESRSATATAGV